MKIAWRLCTATGLLEKLASCPLRLRRWQSATNCARIGNEHYHHHLICKQCGFIGEFHSDLLEEIEQRIAQESGFQVTDHCLRFFGICAECQKKAKEKETQEKPNT